MENMLLPCRSWEGLFVVRKPSAQSRYLRDFDGFGPRWVSFSPVALSTTERAIWLKSSAAFHLDCFLDFFAMPHNDTAQARKEIKIQTDPLPNVVMHRASEPAFADATTRQLESNPRLGEFSMSMIIRCLQI